MDTQRREASRANDRSGTPVGCGLWSRRPRFESRRSPALSLQIAIFCVVALAGRPSGVPMEDLAALTEAGGRQLTPGLDREHHRGGNGRYGSVVEAHDDSLVLAASVYLKDYAVAGHA